MAETDSLHPTAGRRRRQKGPPAAVQAPLPRLELASDTQNEHSDDSAGEKEGGIQGGFGRSTLGSVERLPSRHNGLASHFETGQCAVAFSIGLVPNQRLTPCTRPVSRGLAARQEITSKNRLRKSLAKTVFSLAKPSP